MTTDTDALAYQESFIVTPDESAEKWGNSGIDVLSTPSILGRVEVLCHTAMAPYLDDGQMTVGVSALINHRAPVPVGRAVEYRVSAPAFTGKTVFSFEVRTETGDVACDGTHERAVIDAARFLKRLS
jgi:fluoroacetyl-CoA thioesterase